ncbi:Gfo/Idh/MocA family protein [Agromyces silvae]|uniref:Gfo/Idh/MocA family protein n=1 Tax=Agromyces silvae TaxID=3388266 RepID=UPI00280BE30E|nr:Gfo/Idh/MocA family oxidoreductase [Agromyces protaetiae]
MTRPIGVGLVGLGNSGWFYHAEGTIERSSDFDLVAVWSRTPARTAAAAERFDARGHDAWERLVVDEAVDVVVVATPHHLHAPVALAALAAGKHVVVEKPMAMNATECAAMIAAAERAGRVLTVFHNRRWEPSFLLLRELVDSGELGEVWRVEERRMHRGRYTVPGVDRPHAGSDLALWAHEPAGGGGVTNLISPHLVDHQLTLHGGPPSTVSAVTHTFSDDRVDHYLDLRLGFPEGRLARIEVFREDVVDLPKWALWGTLGTAVCPDFETLRVTLADGRTRTYADLAPLQACDEFYDGLAAAIRDGSPPPVDPRDAAAVVQVIDLAHASARAGGTLLESS